MDGRICDFSQVASVRRYTLSEGSSRGLDVLDCDNGRLRFLLNVSKALDMMQLYHGGVNTSFISKNGFVAREIDFLSRFEGGMLYTCGLDSVGGRDGYELHGTLHNTPAELVSVKCDEGGIAVEAVVRDTALFGKNLLLRRRVTSAIGSDTVSVEDTLINEGFLPEKYCMLYHVNLGYPMLDEGARVICDELSCEPRTPWAAENAHTRYVMSAPEAGREETCYFLKLGKPEVRVENERLGKSFTLGYTKDTLPCFVEWKSMACGDYALGIEPCTTELDDRFAYCDIAPGQSIRLGVSFTVSDI